MIIIIYKNYVFDLNTNIYKIDMKQ